MNRSSQWGETWLLFGWKESLSTRAKARTVGRPGELEGMAFGCPAICTLTLGSCFSVLLSHASRGCSNPWMRRLGRELRLMPVDLPGSEEGSQGKGLDGGHFLQHSPLVHSFLHVPLKAELRCLSVARWNPKWGRMAAFSLLHRHILLC